MKLADVRANAFAMPLNNPAYPKGPYKFYNRDCVVIRYRTAPETLRPLLPEPPVRPRHPEANAHAQQAHKNTSPTWSPLRTPQQPPESHWNSGGRTRRAQASNTPWHTPWRPRTADTSSRANSAMRGTT